MKTRPKLTLPDHENGFGLVEVLVVIVILGILALIAVPIYTQQQRAAKDAASKQSLSYFQKAALAAKTKTGKSLVEITGGGCNVCSTSPTADPLTLPKTDGAWTAYNTMLQRISTASGIDITNLVDGYGRPLYLDENEGENGNCGRDLIGVLADPYAPRAASMSISLPNITRACS